MQSWLRAVPLYSQLAKDLEIRREKLNEVISILGLTIGLCMAYD
jgi:hypothetical protein